mmetsp:Transcript_127585/g.303179  ORF Transcript_127585/g.303179 Transcript_127585/m.303179 type:complete len:153 (-) Transcript_127585:37-495(-)|eukprot:CAMPEP_0181445308 /NCGR_PEP_ID=MMETSP1110-20121109/25520_1 /TAXON_ID=174948 /ORGANISM="Symbiodinium sp., Strain CCMP421" /LENGTH=152 /DNA_ID=CAMNT_0023569347 /DNA_START=65 /DNA_END=523 /DNA_ORIENTATION=-
MTLRLAVFALFVSSSGAVRSGGTGGNGDACPCGDGGLEDNTCCGAGLVCSTTSHTCKPALLAECETRWVGTNCAVSTYRGQGLGLGIACKTYHDDGKKRCCVPGIPGMVSPEITWQYEPINGKAASCCSGQTKEVRWPFPGDDKKYGGTKCK